MLIHSKYVKGKTYNAHIAFRRYKEFVSSYTEATRIALWEAILPLVAVVEGSLLAHQGRGRIPEATGDVANDLFLWLPHIDNAIADPGQLQAFAISKLRYGFRNLYKPKKRISDMPRFLAMRSHGREEGSIRAILNRMHIQEIKPLLVRYVVELAKERFPTLWFNTLWGNEGNATEVKNNYVDASLYCVAQYSTGKTPSLPMLRNVYDIDDPDFMAEWVKYAIRKFLIERKESDLVDDPAHYPEFVLSEPVYEDS